MAKNSDIEECPLCFARGSVRTPSDFVLPYGFDGYSGNKPGDYYDGRACAILASEEKVPCPLCAGYGSVSELLAVAFHLVYPVYKFSNPYLGPKGPLPSRITINELLRDVGRK